MDNNAPIKYSDLIQPDDSLTLLREQLAAVSRQYETLMNDIKREANGVKVALSNVSGATFDGQAAIKEYDALIEKISKKIVQLELAQREETKVLMEKSIALREANNATKLSIKLSGASEGSYVKLSARYAQIKNELNRMSLEERKATKQGQALEKEAAAIYLQMRRLQEATGKHVLSVGDYGVATANLASDIRNGIQALTQMRIEMAQLEAQGQKGSDRWVELSKNSQKLSNDLKDLKRQYQITKLETNALGQQTKGLNDVIGVLSTGAGGLSALTGTLKLFGINSETAAESLVQLNSVMAIANGISQAWNALFKQGNILLWLRKKQSIAAAKAEALLTVATGKATAAQIIYNTIASANPYVLLASGIALLTGGLLLLVNIQGRAIREQKRQNELERIHLEYAKAYDEYSTARGKESLSVMELELRLLQRRKAADQEILDLEKRIQEQREAIHNTLKDNRREEIENLEENRDKLIELQKELSTYQEMSKAGKLKFERLKFEAGLDPSFTRGQAKRIIKVLQDQINNLNERVEIGVKLKIDEAQLQEDLQELAQRQLEADRSALDTETATRQAAEDAKVQLTRQRFDKERKVANQEYEREWLSLKLRLLRDNNLTEKARKNINDRILYLQRVLNQKLEDINNKERAANLAAARATEDARFNAMEDTAQKRKQLLDTEYQRDIEDLQIRLATDKTLTLEEQQALKDQMKAREEQYQTDVRQFWLETYRDDLEAEAQYLDDRLSMVSENTQDALDLRLEAIENQREIELTENRMLAEEIRRDEQEINDKYDRMAREETIKSTNEMNSARLEAELAYEEAVFNLKEHSETEIQKFQLKQQKARLLAELHAQEAMLEILTGEERAEAERTIETIRLQIIAINKELQKTAKVNNIWEVFGFSADIADALQTVADQVLDSLREITEARIAAAEAAEEQAKREADAAQDALQAELEARANGYANEVTTVRKELELRKKAEAEAVQAKKKAQEDQAKIDTLTQISSLITASANIWSALGGISRIAAIAAIATMFGSFAYSKIKAAQIARETYGEGTVELLQGGSHQSGNDVDLGTKPNGTRRRAEGGEFFAVINKRNSRRYRNVIPDVIHSLNDGSFAERYLGASDRVSELAIATAGAGVDVTRIEKDVEEIRKQNETKVYTDAHGNTIITYKNLTRKLKS